MERASDATTPYVRITRRGTRYGVGVIRSKPPHRRKKPKDPPPPIDEDDEEDIDVPPPPVPPPVPPSPPPPPRPPVPVHRRSKAVMWALALVPVMILGLLILFLKTVCEPVDVLLERDPRLALLLFFLLALLLFGLVWKHLEESNVT